VNVCVCGCMIIMSQVVCVPDVTSIYRVPLILEDQKVVEFFATRLGLPLPTPRPRKFLMKWRDLADRCGQLCLLFLLFVFLSSQLSTTTLFMPVIEADVDLFITTTTTATLFLFIQPIFPAITPG